MEGGGEVKVEAGNKMSECFARFLPLLAAGRFVCMHDIKAEISPSPCKANECLMSIAMAHTHTHTDTHTHTHTHTSARLLVNMHTCLSVQLYMRVSEPCMYVCICVALSTKTFKKYESAQKRPRTVLRL